MANLAKIHVSIANNPGEFNANFRPATYEEMFDVSATYIRIFKKNMGIPSQCQTVWIQVRTNIVRSGFGPLICLYASAAC